MNSFLEIFIKGLVFGLTIAAIPGPIFFLIVQRTLHEGLPIGLCVGFGAITADTVYGLIAAMGLTAISGLLIAWQPQIVLLGGLFLIYLGIKTFNKVVKPFTAIAPSTGGLFHAWLSTFFLTLTNPATIIMYTVMFAGLGCDSGNIFNNMLLVLGVITGACLVVITTITFLHYHKHRFSIKTLRAISKVAGIILVLFGIASVTKIWC